MNKSDLASKKTIESSPDDTDTPKCKLKNRGKKRKRSSSGSSTDVEDLLPENTLEVEKSLHASAIKNNLDESSVRKILKKVVTNDHVLALVKLREEEEDSGTEEGQLNVQPKLTRAKVKELMKASPKIGQWSLENLELTPIKHIPVKTRPEVKALISQELHDDEDDDEYQPTHDDAVSDDDQTLESVSDVDSQPRTPATPRTPNLVSPKVLKDGPFKVPQEVSTVRRKLDIEKEEATIALRTRSKLSLSETPIEHIESSFVPPDELPMPDVDDLWNEFLNECLNPASTSKNEDDDETDPEYCVAADPDAHDEDEALEKSIIKISKKELNDLVTELFSIMPEISPACTPMPTDTQNGKVQANPDASVTAPGQWEGKQEPISDDEENRPLRIVERSDNLRVSIGKTEPPDIEEERENETASFNNVVLENDNTTVKKTKEQLNTVNISTEETTHIITPGNADQSPPPSLRATLKVTTNKLCVVLDGTGQVFFPEQVLILQQQIRQHVQLATSNFLQLYVHPVHWQLAPPYKEYLESLKNMTVKNPKSVVNVCNLQPACELVNTWAKTVAENTPENRKMVEYLQSEVDRSRRRCANNSIYIGEFHSTFLNVVSNSSVFLYPYLLPSMPYRSDVQAKRYSYIRPEDELIALGIDQFWDYVESNPKLFKVKGPVHPRRRWGLMATLGQICKHMLPFHTPKLLCSHVQHIRKMRDKENPIYKLLVNRELTPVKHKLLPYNPKLTLYEQPEFEMPRIWLRHLAKSSKRFRDYLHRRTNITGLPPAGVEVDLSKSIEAPTKPPLPIHFTKEIVCQRSNPAPIVIKPNTKDRFDIEIQQNKTTVPSTVPTNLFSVVQTSSGAYLIPVKIETTTINSNTRPITTPIENTTVISNDLPIQSATPQKTNNKGTPNEVISNANHCQCCILLKKICKERQSVITEFFKPKNEVKRVCPCQEKRFPKLSNKLKLLIHKYMLESKSARHDLLSKILLYKNEENCSDLKDLELEQCDPDELATVTSFQLRLTLRAGFARNAYLKKRIYNTFNKFNLISDDPVKLSQNLFQIFGVELVDMYKEFIGFLTPDQADKIDRFKDYFDNNCVRDIVKKIEEQIEDKEKKLIILTRLSEVLADNLSSACGMCYNLLSVLNDAPTLARFVFSLFPHRASERKIPTVIPESPVEARTPDIESQMQNNETDHSSSGDDENDDLNDVDETPVSNDNIKQEQSKSNDVLDTPELTISKTEIQDPESDNSMVIVSDQEYIKEEKADWTRDEDKVILQFLQDILAPKERNDKTILEILEDTHIYEPLSESLARSICDVKARVFVILQMLILGEKTD